jgi:cation transport ATPase
MIETRRIRAALALAAISLALTGCQSDPELTGEDIIDRMVDARTLEPGTRVIVKEGTMIADDGLVSVMISGNSGVGEGVFIVETNGNLRPE